MPRVLGVVASDAAATVNQRVKSRAELDPRGGEFLCTVPLARNGNTVAYWFSWQLSTAQADALRDRLADQFESGKVVPVPRSEKGSFRRDAGVKVYLFDAGEGGWQPDEVLAALRLERVVE